VRKSIQPEYDENSLVAPRALAMAPKIPRKSKPKSRKSNFDGLDLFGSRRANDRAKTKGRTYRSIMKDEDILEEHSE
jgi:hypothetical protein